MFCVDQIFPNYMFFFFPFSRYSEGEIRFNLMAIVSDRKMIYERKIAELQAQLTEVRVDSSGNVTKNHLAFLLFPLGGNTCNESAAFTS